MNPSEAAPDDGVTTRDLIRRISEDVRTIARNEIELLRGEARRVATSAAADGAAVVLGGVVALIGLAMLCTAAAVALAPVLPSLALRLVVMGVVYGGIGGSLAASFAVRLRRNAALRVVVPVHEARATLQGAKAALEEPGEHVHA
ncbi:MAG TPA: phage holin family protein [Kofleriaceae bacterium]|jgi:hypothetical protein|nr:phage holin family protein [Kofleriaceae bacterium]